jgi:hypothetical protein
MYTKGRKFGDKGVEWGYGGKYGSRNTGASAADGTDF